MNLLKAMVGKIPSYKDRTRKTALLRGLLSLECGGWPVFKVITSKEFLGSQGMYFDFLKEYGESLRNEIEKQEKESEVNLMAIRIREELEDEDRLIRSLKSFILQAETEQDLLRDMKNGEGL